MAAEISSLHLSVGSDGMLEGASIIHEIKILYVKRCFHKTSKVSVGKNTMGIEFDSRRTKRNRKVKKPAWVDQPS